MPGTDTKYCAKHPKEPTAVTCATCGKPICPRCMVATPVGMKCKDCTTSRNIQLFKISPARLLLTALVSIVAGVPAGLLSYLGFFVIFLAAGYGYLAGNVILRVSGMKRGLKLEIVAGAGVVIGALAFRLLPALILGKAFHQGLVAFGVPVLMDPFFWIGIAISSACAVSKIRYLKLLAENMSRIKYKGRVNPALLFYISKPL